MKTFLNKQIWKSEILHIIIIVLLFAVAGYYLYQNHHHQVDSLTSKNNQLSSADKNQSEKINFLQSNTDTLTQKNVALQNQVDAYKKVTSVNVPQASYALKVNGVKQYSYPALLPDDTYTLLLVDVSITNNGKATGFVSPSEFTLKDTNNESQQSLTQWSGTFQSIYIPRSFPVQLGSQSLNVNETMHGSLVFHTPTDTTSFVLSYNNQNYPLTVDGKLTPQS